jgi:signal transduction histidine kinase
MSNSPSLDPEISRLQRENQHLSEQVKRLVRAERRMIESQNQFDQQIALYRQLNEVGKQFSKTFSIQDILHHAVQFVIYELNFERCLVLQSQTEERFHAEMWDGYHDETNINQLVIDLKEPGYAPLLAETDYLICSATCEDADLRKLGDRVEMDEFVVFAIAPDTTLEFLLVIGNTAPRAKYHCRIQHDEDALIGLMNLIAQVNAAITQAKLYAQVHDRAATLEQTLQELQQAQTQLVQSEKMSSLGQLVAGVAHEINNPVNFISGNLMHADGYVGDLLHLIQLYRQHYPNAGPEIQEAVESMELDYVIEDLPKLLSSMSMGADRIQEIVASLRIFSRMDEAENKAINIHDGMDSTLMILQHRLKANGRRPAIAIHKAYGDLPLVECYGGQLNQVFMNLLSNAIDALEDQCDQAKDFKPEITIQTRMIDSSWISVSIADNGTGIPEAIQQRLFDPFFTTKAVGKGTGMGLSISHQIITERHNGTLKCVSTPGQGTEFIITIPSRQENSEFGGRN